MTAVTCLQALYHQYLGKVQPATPVELLVAAYLNNLPFESGLVDQVFDNELVTSKASPWHVIEQWREMLTLLLIFKESQVPPSYQQHIIKRVRKLKAVALWSEFQLLAAYRAVVELLLDQSESELALCQFSSGASPQESGGHWSWGDLPQPFFHAELGVLWCLYGQLTSNQRFLQAAEKLALWQYNTLDHEYIPFTGLFSHEGDVTLSMLTAGNFVLFDAVARTSRRPDMAFLAEKQEHITHYTSGSEFVISPHAMLLSTWFSKNTEEIESVASDLPDHFHDRSLAMAGCRLPDRSGVATLYGAGSGFGCFHHKDVQVVNFGPQHLPLGDCRGFGLEGTCRLLASHVKNVEAATGSFKVEGLARMAAHPKHAASSAGFRQGDPSGIWIDAKIEFDRSSFYIETKFNGLFDPTPFAFVFFVKSLGCVVDGRQEIKSRSLQHYQGKIHPVLLKGDHCSLTLETNRKGGEMHVVPLGGGQNFWGADFLIAYVGNWNEEIYSWKIRV